MLDHQMIFALYEMKHGVVVYTVIALAAPEGYNAVLGAVDDADRALILLGCAVDIELLRGERALQLQRYEEFLECANLFAAF